MLFVVTILHVTALFLYNTFAIMYTLHMYMPLDTAAA